MPGMTTSDSPHTQPQSPQQTVATQSLHGVFRAAWVKTTAIAEPGADCQLIGADQQHKRLDRHEPHSDFVGTRLKRTSISARQALRCSLSAALIPASGRFRRSTRSLAGIPPAIRRNASRPCRLIALRNEAARASRFGTIHPSRAAPSLAARLKCKSKLSPRTTRRAAMTAENSFGVCRRWT